MTNERYDPNGNIRNDYQGAQDFNRARELNTYQNKVQQEYTNRVRQQRQNLENKLLRDNPAARGQRDARNLQKGINNVNKKVGDAFNPKPAINDAQRAKKAIGNGVQNVRTGLNGSKAGKAVNNFGSNVGKGIKKVGDAAGEFSKFKGSGSDYVDGFGNAFKNGGGGNPGSGGGFRGGGGGGGLGGVADDVAGGVVGGGIASGIGRVSLGGAARFAGNVGLAIAINTVAVSLANEFQKWIFGDDNDGRGGDTQRVDKRGEPPFLGGQTTSVYVVIAGYVESNTTGLNGAIYGTSTGGGQSVYIAGPVASYGMATDTLYGEIYFYATNAAGQIAKHYLGSTGSSAGGYIITGKVRDVSIIRVDGTPQAADITQGGSRIGEIDGIQTIFNPSVEPKSKPNEIRGTVNIVSSSPSEITKPKPRPFPPPLIAPQPNPKPNETDDEPTARPNPFPPPILAPDPNPSPKSDPKPSSDPFGIDPFPTNPIKYSPIGGNGGPSLNQGGGGLSVGGGSLQQRNPDAIPIPLDKTPKVDPLNPIDLTKDIPEPDIPKPVTEVVKKTPTDTTTQTKHDPCIANNNPCASDIKDTINEGFNSLKQQQPEKTPIIGKIEFDKHEKYENEEGKYTYEFEGENIAGLSNQLDAVSKTLIIVHERMTRMELTLAQSELNYLKSGASIPELMIFWYEAVQKGAKQDKKRTPYITKIPHYTGTKNPKLPKSYNKGSYYAFIKMIDGTRISVNTKNLNEGNRLIKELYYLVDPKYKVPGELIINSGKRNSDKLKEIIVYPSHARYYSQGYSKTAQPDWTSYYWKWS